MQEKANEQPLVTIIMLIYNTGKYITDTLDSIKKQTYKNIQHIVIDDCSKDDSADIAENWIKQNNWPCHFIRNTTNKGICPNLNYAIKELVTGKYVSLIGDDVMMPSKLEDDLAFMEQHPDYMFCYSKMSNFNVVSGIETFPLYRGSDNPFHDYLISGNPIMPTPSLFYRKEIFEKVDYYDERYMCEDFDMILKITYKYPVGFRDAYTIRYVVHPGSMTVERTVQVNNDMIRILKDKWSFVPNYSFYMKRRYLNMFCLFAKEHKKEAIKYIPDSLRFFYSKLFIAGLFIFLFRWPKTKKKR